jgi:hypothetical protein
MALSKKVVSFDEQWLNFNLKEYTPKFAILIIYTL